MVGGYIIFSCILSEEEGNQTVEAAYDEMGKGSAWLMLNMGWEREMTQVPI